MKILYAIFVSLTLYLSACEAHAQIKPQADHVDRLQFAYNKQLETLLKQIYTTTTWQHIYYIYEPNVCLYVSPDKRNYDRIEYETADIKLKILLRNLK